MIWTGYAGITLELGILNMSTHNGVFDALFPVNNDATNNGSWKDSLMRTETMPLMKSYMPPELQEIIVPVKKYTGVGGGSSSGVEMTVDELFLPSEIEIFGQTTYSVDGEGSRYALYSSVESAVRYRSGSALRWVARSPRSGRNNYFCAVNADGEPTYTNPSSNQGVSFVFCV